MTDLWFLLDPGLLWAFNLFFGGMVAFVFFGNIWLAAKRDMERDERMGEWMMERDERMREHRTPHTAHSTRGTGHPAPHTAHETQTGYDICANSIRRVEDGEGGGW